MTPVNQQHDDTKILLTVAGVVVAGAAGLAFFAGMGETDTQATRAEARQVAPAAVADAPIVAEEAAQPAVFFGSGTDLPSSDGLTGTASLDKLGGSTVTAALDGVSEETPEVFEIGPGEDLIAEGLKAWNSADYGRAAAYFGAQSEARESDAWANYMTGLSLWKSGRADEAVVAMERAAELDPTFIRTPINLSRIQNDRGDYEQALTAALSAVAIDPNSPQARFLEGRSLNNLDRRDEAIAALQASIDLSDTNGYVHNLLGLVLLAQGDSEQAADILERAADLEPNVAFVHNNLGMALEHCGEREAARVAYRRAVDVNGAYQKAVRNLARLEPVTPASSDESVAEAVPNLEVEDGTPAIVETADSRSLD